jgi:hypothetical protein
LSQRLRLELAPSPAMACVIIAAHALAAACLALVVPGAAGLALAAALLALGAASAWLRALLRSSASVRAIELEASGVVVELADGERIAAQVGKRRHVSRLTVTLALQRPLRRTLLVSRDMLSADSFRLLRIWALWGKLPGVAAKQLPA